MNYTTLTTNRNRRNPRRRIAMGTFLALTAATAPGMGGCNNAGEGGITGAGLGAGAGAIIGSLSGDAGKGAAIGAVLGGLSGAVIGDQNHRRSTSYSDYNCRDR